jgi:threonine dehydrogenase-like Zn-dependent dehydrogenase
VQALCFDGELRLVDNYPQPKPPPGEALVRVTTAQICNTDLEITRGYMNSRGVLGHEFVGVVESSPDPSQVGRRVVGEINTACGACDYCRAGLTTHCRQRTTLGIVNRDGVFAEYLTLPATNLLLVPDGLPDETAVFTELLAAAVEIPDQAHIRPTDRVVVIGDGEMGLLAAEVLALTGCDLLAVGHHADKLAILAKRGIPTTLEADLPALTADVVVECSGHAGGFAVARRLLRPRGSMVLKSTYHGQITVDLSSLVVEEIKVLGSRCGPFAPALRLLERGLVTVDDLVSGTYPLSEGLAAFRQAGERGTLKIMLKPGR